MAADSRNTHTDALATLGTIINDQEKRDAIHLGVEPVQAGETLRPGMHVGYGHAGLVYEARDGIKAVGIVDPFIQKRGGIKEGEWFWLIVYPRQITSLRHVWEHPDFPDSKETSHEKAEEVAKKEPLTEEQMHKALLLIHDPVATAKQWIIDYAARLSDDEYTVTADELINTAMSNYYSSSKWGGDYLVKGGLLEGESVSDEFWSQLAILKEINIPEDKRNNFFSCSC